MASNAVLSEHHMREPVRQAPIAVSRFFSMRPRVVTRLEGAEKTIDLNLRAGVKIVYGATEQGDPLTRLLVIADTIKEYECLPAGWDSYGAAALNDKAVVPALELAIHAIHRCQMPAILPLPTGGLGLRFHSATKELEIDIGPDGRCTALFENLADGEMEELAEPQKASDIFPMVNAYCRAD